MFSFDRRHDDVPTDALSESLEHRLRHKRREKPQLSARQLFHLDFHIPEHPKQLARFLAAVDFDEGPRSVIAELDDAAHDLLGRTPSQKLGAEQTASQNDLDPIVQRIAMVKHHFRYAARLEHAMQLADRAGSIGCVMQDAIRINHIEAPVAERQVLAVGDHEIAVSAVKTETMTCNLDRAWREIDPGAARPATRELQQVRAHAATNLQQLRAAKLVEAHHPRHPCGILVITIALDLVEKLARPELMFAIVFGATRVLTPLLTRTQFFFSQPAHQPVNPENPVNPVLTIDTPRALSAHYDPIYAPASQLSSPSLPTSLSTSQT